MRMSALAQCRNIWRALQTGLVGAEVRCKRPQTSSQIQQPLAQQAQVDQFQAQQEQPAQTQHA